MTENFDKTKVVEDLFSPDISIILAELEDGGKESSFLASKIDISEDEIKARLNYLIESGFVEVSNSPLTYSVNANKIAKIMENEENYKGVIDGLTELDSYLN